ncbi:hypothetical protein KWD61_17360 [Acinetobacter baumannii]
MPKFLIIAEKVYKKLEEDKLFSDNLIEQLNNLVSIIRKVNRTGFVGDFFI